MLILVIVVLSSRRTTRAQRVLVEQSLSDLGLAGSERKSVKMEMSDNSLHSMSFSSSKRVPKLEQTSEVMMVLVMKLSGAG
jgi:hypothetical protein